MNPYTVVGYYESTGELWTQHVAARDWLEARLAAIASLGHDDVRDICLVDIYYGHVRGLREANTVVCAIDILNEGGDNEEAHYLEGEGPAGSPD